MYIDFKKCMQLATQLLSKQQLSSTKIDIMKLTYDKAIVFDSIQNYCIATKTPITKFYKNGKLRDGCTIGDDELYFVLYNENLCRNRINWTIAHEIGHIYMRHKHDTDKEEIEAHFFAAQLLMPEYVLIQLYLNLGRLTKNDLTTLFFVSGEAAEKRITTFKNKDFFTMDAVLDIKIWDMMKDDVMKYCDEFNSPKNPLPYIRESDNYFRAMEDNWLYGFL